MMWPYSNPMIPFFENAKRAAANLPPYGEKGTYAEAMFQQDFPQFYQKTKEEGTVVYTPLVPSSMLEQFIDLANSSVIPSIWGAQWRYAAGLFTAHWAAMYLKTYADGSPSTAAAASSAGQVGLVASASMGDTSISYDNTAVNSGTEKWGTWNATQYGAQLATMARMIGSGGVYVI